MSTETTLGVVGMSCEHCVNAVTEELSRLDGVNDVVVDLASGRVAVTSVVGEGSCFSIYLPVITLDRSV